MIGVARGRAAGAIVLIVLQMVLRSLPEERDILLVALTGWGQDLDRQRTGEAGFDLHLVKPVSLEDLNRVLAAAQDSAGGSRRQGDSAHGGPDPR